MKKFCLESTTSTALLEGLSSTLPNTDFALNCNVSNLSIKPQIILKNKERYYCTFIITLLKLCLTTSDANQVHLLLNFFKKCSFFFIRYVFQVDLTK
jgi:hypothetical protein